MTIKTIIITIMKIMKVIIMIKVISPNMKVSVLY